MKTFHDYQETTSKNGIRRRISHSKEEGKMEDIKEGKIEGIREGELKGMKKGKMETAVGLLRRGFDLNLVIEVTNLPTSKLKDLKY
jgi:predicted transposase YdaD